MSGDRGPVNRMLVGVLAAGFLLTGTWMLLTGGAESAMCATLLRVGVLLGAFWLALPTKGRGAAWEGVNLWGLVGVVGALLLFVRNPRAFVPIAIGVFVVSWFLRPRNPRRLR